MLVFLTYFRYHGAPRATTVIVVFHDHHGRAHTTCKCRTWPRVQQRSCLLHASGTGAKGNIILSERTIWSVGINKVCPREMTIKGSLIELPLIELTWQCRRYPYHYGCTVRRTSARKTATSCYHRSPRSSRQISHQANIKTTDRS